MPCGGILRGTIEGNGPGTVYLLFHGDSVALRRRPAHGLLAGLWEYPNEIAPYPCPVPGKVEFAATGKHIFTHKEWHMTAYTVMAETNTLPEGWVWADKGEWTTVYALPSAFAAFTHIVDDKLT